MKPFFSVESNLTHTVCRCNHLTHFAILMDVNAVSQQLNALQVLVLTFITRIGLAVSVTSLALAVLAFTFVPNMKNTRTIIHRNLRWNFGLSSSFNSHALGIAAEQSLDFEIDFTRNPISASAAWFFVIILKFIFTAIFEIKNHVKNSLAPKKFHFWSPIFVNQ